MDENLRQHLPWQRSPGALVRKGLTRHRAPPRHVSPDGLDQHHSVGSVVARVGRIEPLA